MIALVRAEFRRLLSTAAWKWALLGAAGVGGGLVGLIALIGPENSDPPLPGLETAEGAGMVLGLVSLTVIIPALFGATAVTSEYRHGTITPTFLFAPRRGGVLTAKLLVYAVAGLVYGLVTALSAGVALQAGAIANGVQLGVSTGTLAALLLRVAVTMAVYTVLGVGVGALLRNQVAALAVIGFYLYMGESLLLFIPGVNTIYPFLPGGATSALTDFTLLADAADQAVGIGAGLLSPPAGALVLLAYTLVAAALAIALPLRRDVT
ncbi:ABC transporter permease subunit [Streptosporangium soli]|nr:ABC transporter permease subunit [Streptosporangium sp. KLBMP 9127]